MEEHNSAFGLFLSYSVLSGHYFYLFIFIFFFTGLLHIYHGFQCGFLSISVHVNTCVSASTCVNTCFSASVCVNT